MDLFKQKENNKDNLISKRVLSNDINQSIDNAYGKENLWKLSFKTILPSLLLTLLFGIYIFVDQILIVNLVPKDGHNYLQTYFQNIGQLDLYNRISQYISSNQNISLSVSNNISDFIAYPTSNLIGPFSLIILSFGYLISAGGAVLFSKSLALNDNDLHKKVVWNTFYATIIFSVVATILMIFIQDPILKTMVPQNVYVNEVIGNNSNNITIDELNQYLKLYYQGTVDQANQYIYWINGGILLTCLTNLFIFYLRGESKNLWVTLMGVFANILNVVLDVILLSVVKTGIMGGGIATFSGQFVNLLLISIYLIYLNKKQQTTIKFNLFKIKKNIFDFKILTTSFLLGSSTFLRELSLAIANIVYVPIFMSTVGTIDTLSLQSYSSLVASPIYNLFFFSIFGIIDGMRPIISYNYSLKQYNRVKVSFWIGLSTALVYSFLVISLTFSIIPYNQTILPLLNAKSDFDQQNLFTLLLSMMWQFPFISLSVSGLALFQSANKKIANIVLSITQGAITFYPILYIMSFIALSTNNVNVMVFTGFTNIVVSSLIIFGFSLFFISLFKNNKIEKYENKWNKVFNKFNKQEQSLSKD